MRELCSFEVRRCSPRQSHYSPQRRCLHLGKSKPCKKKATILLRRMSLRLGEGRWALQKLAILLPFFAILKAHFLKPINGGSLDLSRV